MKHSFFLPVLLTRVVQRKCVLHVWVVALLVATTVGCGSKSSETKTASATPQRPASPKADPAAVTEATPPAPDPASTPSAVTEPASPASSDANKDDPKHIAHMLELMNSRVESYYYINQKMPKDIVEFKAWKHPNYPMGELEPWPSPPTGKNWKMKGDGVIEVK